MKSIRMVHTGNSTLFLMGMNQKGELIFRSSYESKLIQREKPVIENETCYLNLYFFPAKYLEELATINE